MFDDYREPEQDESPDHIWFEGEFVCGRGRPEPIKDWLRKGWGKPAPESTQAENECTDTDKKIEG